MTELQDLAEVVTEARRLRDTLVGSLPGDLGRLAGMIVGLRDPATLNPRIYGLGPSPALTGGAPPGAPPLNPLAWAPSVLALCCQAYGQPINRTIPVGATLELLGIVSAALDTAQDEHQDRLELYEANLAQDRADSAQQRVSPGVLSNVGVALIGLAWQALLEYGPQYGVPAEQVVAMGQLLAVRWTTICQAQHLDLTVGRSPQLPLEEYEQIVAGKAGEMGGTACEVGAILAGAEDHRALWHTLGIERTIAQQLCDDAQDLGRDLAQNQQISQVVRYGLAVVEPAQKEALLDLLEQTRRPGAETARHTLLHWLEELGGVQYVLVSLALHRQRAQEALAALPLSATSRAWLEQWIAAATVVPLKAADKMA